MRGLMQDWPLTLPHVLHRAEQLFGHKPIVTATANGETATTVADWAVRVRRLATALDALGVPADGRVATFCWNTAPHLELYLAAPVHRPGAAHAQHPAVPRAAGLRRQPRRRRRRLRRPLAAAAVLAAAGAADHRPARRGDRRRRRRSRARRRARLRGAARRAQIRSRAGSRSTTRTAPRPCATAPGRPAARRAWSTATGPRCCTR